MNFPITIDDVHNSAGFDKIEKWREYLASQCQSRTVLINEFRHSLLREPSQLFVSFPELKVSDFDSVMVLAVRRWRAAVMWIVSDIPDRINATLDDTLAAAWIEKQLTPVTSTFDHCCFCLRPRKIACLTQCALLNLNSKTDLS